MNNITGTLADAAAAADSSLSEVMMESSYGYEGAATTFADEELVFGKEIQQTWNYVFVVYAYLIATVASYSAVHLLDHCLWRTEELKKAAIIKYPEVYAAIMLGFGAVWCMHYVGMAAVTLEGTPICYDWGITMGSLAAVLVMMLAAIKVCGNDVFATPDRKKILEGILYESDGSDHTVTDLKQLVKVVSLHKLHYLMLGAFLAGSGAVVMHYTGMMAQRGPFRKEWNIWYIAISCLMAIGICFAGFWIMFRARWQIKQIWLRFVSAAIIALAVCGLHFFGMLSVSYYTVDPANLREEDFCHGTWEQNNASPNAWTLHQIIVVGIAVVVPMLAFYVSNIINQELILAYEVTAKSQAIVTSLFPSQFRDRMMADHHTANEKSKLKKFLNGKKDADLDASRAFKMEEDRHHLPVSKPIADLFPDTTIMFADLAGFTAWSSEREPSQVFMLLETVYHSFDEIAKRHNIFKVETIGDCYVAVAGLPDPMEDHAVVMSRVASLYVYKMAFLTQALEVKLGPDTGDLKIRIGLHSGAVTAGVLRGERARFQLFGDTMNLASRMESTGLPGHVQISGETASLLRAAGKEGWVTPRSSQVMVKGKGMLQTYWLKVIDSPGSTCSSLANPLEDGEDLGDWEDNSSDGKESRLIEWNVDLLKNHLRQIIARRNASACGGSKGKSHKTAPGDISPLEQTPGSETVLEEVCEIIELPEFDSDLAKKQQDPASVILSDAVVKQLREYVTMLAGLYRNNPFHSFEHASHVTMSVAKLLSRIKMHASDIISTDKSVEASQHDHTYGITSDPLTQFACILASLIHDVDHEGVPNSQLVKEASEVAQRFNNKSVAEQNSVCLAWDLLMIPQFTELRSAIGATEDEWTRLRQLIVNTVMATDIMDPDLKNQRNARWHKAFSEQRLEEDPQLTTNRKATIVLEHLIQASDVAHTMQHWHVYRKWNERLFMEMRKAFDEGRSEKDPAEFWYKGEMGFFDFYIIPLAKKLKDCGVFGVASDEYYNFAIENRKEWESRGAEIVVEMVEKHRDSKAGCDSNAETLDSFSDSEEPASRLKVRSSLITDPSMRRISFQDELSLEGSAAFPL